MRRAGDVCFSQVFRDRGGKLNSLKCSSLWDAKYHLECNRCSITTFL